MSDMGRIGGQLAREAPARIRREAQERRDRSNFNFPKPPPPPPPRRPFDWAKDRWAW